MDFSLSEELLAFRDLARDFAEKEIAPKLDEDDKAHRFRRELVEKMGELGFFGCLIPEEYGGNEAGFLASVIMCEEIGKVSAAHTLPFNMQAHGPAYTLLRWGTEEQKRKYIPGLVAGKLIGGFAITEPDTGSDVASMKTTARKDGDYYILNGSKMWISNAHVADCLLVYAKTDPSAGAKGISCFIVDTNTPGFSARAIEDKLGIHCAPTGEITFEDCRIPKEALVGQEGEGFKICMWQLDNTRLSCAARALGVAAACLKAVVEYANQRTQFGQPIGRFQMIQDEIAQMAVEEEAARFLVYRAAWQKDQDPNVRNTKEVSMAKYYAAEVAVKAANEAMKIFGSYGYSEEYPVARYLRDAKSFQVVEGTSNIQKLIIAGHVLGYRK